MTEPDKTGISLKLLVLKTGQVERLLAFYQSLGIAFAQEQHGRGPIHHSGQIGGVVLELYPLVDDDHRTPMSESEQYYQALKLRKVATVLLRVPGAPHDIAQRPSHMMTKAAYVLKWFEMRRQEL